MQSSPPVTLHHNTPVIELKVLFLFSFSFFPKHPKNIFSGAGEKGQCIGGGRHGDVGGGEGGAGIGGALGGDDSMGYQVFKEKK